MNIKSIITSGLLAGIVINISAITMVPVVGNQMDAVFADFGLPPLSSWDMVYFIFASFLYGIALMLLYAILKPLLNTKVKTIVVTTLVVWTLAYLLNIMSLIVYGFMPVKLAITGIVWGFFELLLGNITGSFFYKSKK